MNLMYLMFDLLCVVCALKRDPLCDLTEQRYNIYAECVQNTTDHIIKKFQRSKCSEAPETDKYYHLKHLSYKNFQKSCKLDECVEKLPNSKEYAEMRPKLIALLDEQKKCVHRLYGKSLPDLCNLTETNYTLEQQCSKLFLQKYRRFDSLQQLHQKCYDEAELSYQTVNEISYQSHRKSCESRERFSECRHKLINSPEYKKLIEKYSHKQLNTLNNNVCRQKVLDELTTIVTIVDKAV